MELEAAIRLADQILRENPQICIAIELIPQADGDWIIQFPKAQKRKCEYGIHLFKQEYFGRRCRVCKTFYPNNSNWWK